MADGVVEKALVGMAIGAILGLGSWVWRKYSPPRESDTLKEVCERKPAADTKTKSKSPWSYDSLRDGPLWRFLVVVAAVAAAGCLIALTGSVSPILALCLLIGFAVIWIRFVWRG